MLLGRSTETRLEEDETKVIHNHSRSGETVTHEFSSSVDRAWDVLFSQSQGRFYHENVKKDSLVQVLGQMVSQKNDLVGKDSSSGKQPEGE